MFLDDKIRNAIAGPNRVKLTKVFTRYLFEGYSADFHLENTINIQEYLLCFIASGPKGNFSIGVAGWSQIFRPSLLQNGPAPAELQSRQGADGKHDADDHQCQPTLMKIRHFKIR